MQERETNIFLCEVERVLLQNETSVFKIQVWDIQTLGVQMSYIEQTKKIIRHSERVF